MVVEYVTGVSAAALALARVGATFIGILGLVGASRNAPCSCCGHWSLVGGTVRIELCPTCRRGQLRHPLSAIAHLEVYLHKSHG